MADTYTCAVWYMRYFRPEYELCADEKEAAEYAVAVFDGGSGSILGVQFADGRTIPVNDWNFFDETMKRLDAENEARIAAQKAVVPPPAREALDPFNGEPLKIELDEPAWLGRPA